MPVRDLFGIDVDAAALLPTDDISDGFDNIADALKVSPSFLDQYIMAARAVAKQAIGTPPSSKEAKTTLRGVDPERAAASRAHAAESPRSFWRPTKETMNSARRAIPRCSPSMERTSTTNGRTHLKAGLHTIVAANAGHSLRRE